MLELLDLRERGERLEAVRPEIDPTVSETVQRILQRVFVEGDEVLVELAQRFDDADLSETGLMVRREEFAVAEHETPADLKWALDALIDRLRDLHARQLPSEWWEDPTASATARSSDRSAPSAATSPAGEPCIPPRSA